MRQALNRRTCLRGLGASLPLPFLGLMESASNNSNTPPLRFVSLFKPNGVHTPSWNVSGGNYDSYHMSPLMEPLAKHKKDLLVIDQLGDFGFSAHKDATRRFMCGHHKNTKSASLDQIIADKIGRTTPVRSLELTTEGLFPNQIGCSYISYDQNGKPIPRSSDPQMVFDQLFRNDMTHPQKRKKMGSLLDRVRSDAKSLEKKVGRDDHHILDQYFTVLRQTEKKLESLNSTTKPKIDFDQLERPVATQDFDQRVESMFDVISMALWTDSTRCASYMLGNSNSRLVFDFLGIQEQHHYLSHYFRNFTRKNLESLLKITNWHMEKFDSLLTKMKSFKDHHGTLLDHSLVLFGSGMGHSDNHTVQRVPTIIAGKAGGKIKTGHYIRYAENQPLNRLHLAIMKKFGVEKDQFASDEKFLTGLSGEPFHEHKEKSFDSWMKNDKNLITVQGRLRQSAKLDEGNTIYADLNDGRSVKIQVKFRDFHDFNLPYHNGTAVNIEGEGKLINNQWTIHKIKNLKSIFGHAPGKSGG